MSARPGAPARRARLKPPAHSSEFLQVATLRDAAAIAALRCSTAVRLTDEFGQGPWSAPTSERGVRFEMTRGVLYVARDGRRPIATLTVSPRKPWAIDPACFSASRLPLYLTGMAVTPGRQRGGLGRRCMRELRKVAADWQADAVRLDAWDAPAGAGGFYARCGLREAGRVVYRGAPLVYFEWLLG